MIIKNNNNNNNIINIYIYKDICIYIYIHHSSLIHGTPWNPMESNGIRPATLATSMSKNLAMKAATISSYG